MKNKKIFFILLLSILVVLSFNYKEFIYKTESKIESHEQSVANPLPLLRPSEFNNLKRAISNGLSVSYIGKSGNSLLTYAVMNKNYEATALLLKKGVNPNLEGQPNSPLYAATNIYNENPELSIKIIKLLISHDADINYTKIMNEGMALYWPTVVLMTVCSLNEDSSVNKKNIETILKLLLSQKIKPRPVDVNNAIALFTAPKINRLDVDCSKAYLSLLQSP